MCRYNKFDQELKDNHSIEDGEMSYMCNLFDFVWTKIFFSYKTKQLYLHPQIIDCATNRNHLILIKSFNYLPYKLMLSNEPLDEYCRVFRFIKYYFKGFFLVNEHVKRLFSDNDNLEILSSFIDEKLNAINQ